MKVSFLFAHQKMAINWAIKEVEYMLNRYEEVKELYPYLEVFDEETALKSSQVDL